MSHDAARLGNAYVSGARDRSGLGAHNRDLDSSVRLCLLFVLLVLTYCTLNPEPAGASTYTKQGQVLKLPGGSSLRPGDPNYSYIKKMMYDQGLLPMAVDVAAQVGVEGTVGKVAKWINLSLEKVPAAKIAKVALQAGMLVGTGAAANMLALWGYHWLNDEVVKEVPSGGYVPGPGAVGVGSYSWNSGKNNKTAYAVLAPDDAACNSLVTEHEGWVCNCSYLYNSIISAGWQDGKWGTNRCCWAADHVDVCITPSGGNTVVEATTYQAVTSQELLTKIEDSLSTLVDQGEREEAWRMAQDAVEAVGPGVSAANNNWPGDVPASGGYSPMTDAQGSEVQQALNDGVPADVKDDMGQDGNSSTSRYIQGLTDWEYTPEQMAAAQKVKDLEREAAWVTDWTANKPADGNGSSIDAGSYTLPERRDLPGVLTTFKNAVGSLPLVSWANGFHVTVTGASSLMTLPLPAGMGGPINVDFADYEGVLDTMGNGLYALVGIASVLFLFRGRGD